MYLRSWCLVSPEVEASYVLEMTSSSRDSAPQGKIMVRVTPGYTTRSQSPAWRGSPPQDLGSSAAHSLHMDTLCQVSNLGRPWTAPLLTWTWSSIIIVITIIIIILVMIITIITITIIIITLILIAHY
jgi:hypothetical protein